VHCTELLFDAVYKCMQVVGVNSVDCRHPFEKLLREAAIFPLYDAGNFGMQRRRVHGVMSADSFNPRAIMNDEPMDYTKAMEVTDTISGHELEVRQLATVS
jgi:acyl-CoA dehydrogenase